MSNQACEIYCWCWTLNPEPMSRLGWFSSIKYNIGGLDYSADDMEHGILRGNSPTAASLSVLVGHPEWSKGYFKKDDPRLKQVECMVLWNQQRDCFPKENPLPARAADLASFSSSSGCSALCIYDIMIYEILQEHQAQAFDKLQALQSCLSRVPCQILPASYITVNLLFR